MAFKKLKEMFGGSSSNETAEDYVEIDLNQDKKDNKVLVKLFSLREYEDSNLVLNAIREGYTIAIIDIKNLKKKDPIELKRAISKIKKTVQALEGNIAGFGESTVIMTPSFAKIDREMPKVKTEKEHSYEDF
jgi:SepF-like predicted cell division protein (DUF552 family)